MSAFRTIRYEWQRIPKPVKIVAGFGGLYAVSSIETLPISGRKRMMLLPYSFDEYVGQQAYQQELQSRRVLPASDRRSKVVNRIGQKIIQHSANSKLNWRFHVVEDSTPNAFCLPGGKVFVNTGLFKTVRNEDMLAAVLFHEAAHGIARHGTEKVQGTALLQTLLYSVFFFFLPDASSDMLRMSDFVLRMATELPFSRKLESEADLIGLKLMSKACYPPEASLEMNRALAKLNKGSDDFTSKYFSTHPPSKERIEAIRQHLPDAKAIYESFDCAHTKQSFRRIMQ